MSETENNNKYPHVFVFEGVDCCGKTFLMQLVERDLRLRGLNVKIVSFPMSKKDIKNCTDEKIKAQIIIRDFNRVHKKFEEGDYDEYDVILFDRYIFSLLIYQLPLMSKIFFFDQVKFLNQVKISHTFFIDASEQDIRDRLEDRIKNNAGIGDAERKGIDYLLQVKKKYQDYSTKVPKRSSAIENTNDLRSVKFMSDIIVKFHKGKTDLPPALIEMNAYENCEHPLSVASRNRRHAKRALLQNKCD